MNKGVDHIGVGVVFYCHDGKGNFIMSKRTDKCRDEHGKWDPGGGSVDFGETIISALKREIMEEYCTDVVDYEFLGFRDVHRIDEKGRKTHWVSFDYKVLVDADKAKNGDPEKHEKIAWFKLDALPHELHSQMPEFVRKYQDKLQQP